MSIGDDVKARIRRRKQTEEAKEAVAAMVVKALPVAGHYSHVGTIHVGGKIVRYYGRMVGDCFVYDPAARDVI